MRLSSLACAAALLALSTSVAAAQTSCNTNGCSLTNTISVTVPVVVTMAITSNATTLTAPTDVNYGTVALPGTATSNAGPSITVKANRSWTLSVNAPVSFTPGGGSAYAKPSSDVQVQSGATTVTLSNVNQTIASGAATASSVAALTYLTKYVWTLDTPGTYSLAVAYTLTAP